MGTGDIQVNESMHELHDLDLISDLAEGAAADPAPAQDLIATCADCAEIYESHVAVLEAVRSDTFTPMNDLERRRIRSSVWQEIGPATAPQKAASSTPWWYRLAPVAAALALIVGVAVPLSNLGSGGDSIEASVDAFEPAGSDSGADEGRIGLAPPDSDSAAAGQESLADTTTPAETMAADGTMSMANAWVGAREITAAELESTTMTFVDRVGKAGLPAEPAAECAQNDPGIVGQILSSEPLLVDGVEAWMVAFELDDGSQAARVYTAECALLYPNE